MTPEGKGDTGVFNKPAEKKAEVSEAPIRSMSPARFVASAWIVILLLSVYGIESLYDRAVKNESDDWVMNSVTNIADFAEWSGVSDAKKVLDGLVSPIIDGKRYMKRVEEIPVEKPQEIQATASAELDPETNREAAPLPHEQAPIKKRILIVGASSIQGHLGTALVETFELYGGIKVKRFGKLSTGLVRPDQLNWPEKLDELAAEFRPDLIITNFGGNDAQGIKLEGRKVAKWGTTEWDREYAERVRAIVEIGNKYNAVIVNLGMPVMRSKKFSKRMERLNRVTREATEMAGAVYVSTWEMAATPYGEYRKDVRFKGERGLLRAGDGVHYSSLGARFVAEQVLQDLERRFRFIPKGDELASVTKHTVTSEHLGKKRSYLAFVPPSSSKDNRVPLIILLHDEGGAWDYWSRRSHRALQRAAVKHSVVFVSPDLGLGLDLLKDSKSEGFVVEELLADVRHHLPVSDTVSLLGHGKGGFVALALALRSPGIFGRASSLAAQPLDDYASLEALGQFIDESRGVPELFMSVGEEDGVRPQHDSLVKLLKAKGIKTGFLEHKRKLANRFSVEELEQQIRWHAEPSKEKTPSTTGSKDGASSGS
jgi:pimeloyl-ACP methyl ester carboxylesterase